MRVLRIDSWDGREGGGAQAYVRTVSAELEKLGHPQRTISVTNAPAAEAGPGEVRTFAPVGRGLRAGFDIVSAPAAESTLEAAIAEFNPEVIHLHHFDAAFQSITRVLRRSDRPLVVTAHDAEMVCPISTLVRPGNIICEGGVRYRCMFTGCRVGFGLPYNLWQGAVFSRQVAPKVSAYLAPSRALREYLEVHGFRPAAHLPSFAEVPPSVAAAPLAERPADSAPTVGFLGRLEPYKGIFDLLEAWPIVRSTVPTARLEIAGAGPSRASILELISRRDWADSVHLSGWVSGKEKEAWFAGIDVLAFPSNQWENLGFVALEALARGRPVVATKIGGIPDVVEDGVSGRLVPISNPPALGRALIALLLDRGQARRWGMVGRERTLREFDPALHVQRLLEVYRDAIDGFPVPLGWATPPT